MPRLSPSRRSLAGAIVVAALPLPVAALMTTGSGRLALAACLALPLAVLGGGPSLWPEWRRARCLILVGPAAAALLAGGAGFAVLAIGALCTSDQTHDYLSALGACAAIAAFVLPYAAGSAWAVGRARRVVWAWPLVIVCAIALGSAALLLLEGGVHHCET
jgi:hypothetical protein